MSRRVIEAVFIDHNPDVRKIAEEDESSELVLLSGSRSSEA